MRRQSSSTTPPHLIERQIIPTSPQLSRPSINYFDGSDRVTQTPRRTRNNMPYVNGVNGIRPVSREGSTTYVRDGSSPAVPALARAQTSSAISDLTVSRSRLPRQSGAHRLSRQSTRDSLNGGAKESTVSTPTLTPVAERRKENLSSDRIARHRNVEIHSTTGASRRMPTNRRHNTAPEDGWA